MTNTTQTIEWQAAKAQAPEWAQAAIVAELQQDESDSQTDYFATRTTRRILLGWSRSKRFSFRECRKLAATDEVTAHLADSGKDAEHRETYSMGRGMVLGAGAYSSGWTVVKWRTDWDFRNSSDVEIGSGCKMVEALAATVEEPVATANLTPERVAYLLEISIKEASEMVAGPDLLETLRAVGMWLTAPKTDAATITKMRVRVERAIAKVKPLGAPECHYCAQWSAPLVDAPFVGGWRCEDGCDEYLATPEAR